MAKMQAAVLHNYGGAEVLKLEEIDRPVPEAGQVLVKVHAASVNPMDWKVRQGYLASFVQYELPMVPGVDFSGTVAAVGPGVSHVKVGDEVFGQQDFSKRFGTFAEYVVVDATRLGHKPKALDHVHAAAVPVAGLAAWHALLAPGMIDPKPGKTILIHAAAGGVGSFAVQLAKWKGARVIGTGSAASEAFIRKLGADEFIDYKKQRFEQVARNLDGVLDGVGDEVVARSWHTLKPGGVLASVAAQNLTPPADAPTGVRGVNAMGSAALPELAQLAALLDKGIIKVEVTKVLPLSEAGEATRLVQAGHSRGKLALKIV
jgi:NADPH:quinone reductase-like Zn-dependent oxidoreductase